MKPMKQTLFYTIASFLFAFASYGQWSGTSAELLTSGDATIESNIPNLFFNDLSGPLSGFSLRSGLVFQENGNNRLYNFYSSGRNEMYWADTNGWDDTDGSSNVLSLDLDMADMDSSTPGFVQFGPKDAAHLDFDANEIQAKIDTDFSNLYINYLGGNISLGDVVSHGGLFYNRSEKSVGIGTNTPNDELHVVGQARIQNETPNLKFMDENNVQKAIFQYTTVAQSASSELAIYSTDNMTLYAGLVGGAKLSLLDNGNVGIGENNPAHTLDVNGDGNFTGELTAASDLRLKHHIKTLENASHILNKLNPVSYEFKYEAYPDLSLSQGVRLGLIAQEVEDVLPNLVSEKSQVTEEDGTISQYKSVNYIDLIPILIKSHQEQSALIAQLIDDIELLKSDTSR